MVIPELKARAYPVRRPVGKSVARMSFSDIRVGA
jgi:hypothetical protein